MPIHQMMSYLFYKLGMLWIVYWYYFEMDHVLSANAVSWLILSPPSNSKKGVDDLLGSKLTKTNDTINSNFAL
jgi:hypothetical protein